MSVRVGNLVISDPQVSIIMPSYKVASYISEALESVFAQTYSEYEIIVINDGSPDTPELELVLEPYLEQIVYVKQKNLGLAETRNVGIRTARAKIIAQLDPDDAWFPTFLEVHMGIMRERPDIDVLYSDAIIFGGSRDDGKTLMDFSPSVGEVTFRSLVRQNCTVFTCVTATRDSLFRAGGYDSELEASEDFDIWLRVVKSGGRIDYHRRVLARYRKRRDSLSADPVRMSDSILHVLKKAEDTLELTADERQAIAETRDKFRAHRHLINGKNALRSRDTALAIDCLQKANSYFNRIKISSFILLLRFAPRIAELAFNVNERYVRQYMHPQ